MSEDGAGVGCVLPKYLEVIYTLKTIPYLQNKRFSLKDRAQAFNLLYRAKDGQIVLRDTNSSHELSWSPYWEDRAYYIKFGFSSDWDKEAYRERFYAWLTRELGC